MARDQHELNLTKLQQTIDGWLQTRLDKDSFISVRSTFDEFRNQAEDWFIFSSFSKVSRVTGKDPLMLTDSERQAANNLRHGWTPAHWSLDQLARSFLLLGLAERDKGEFLEKLDKLFISSDLAESVALYQALPVLPYPAELRTRAAEGIRTNITSVFNAVALRNPYPADYLDDDAWNQVILKSLFIGSPLYLVLGVDRRANSTLAHMLIEYAHERWAAGRDISPELWRSVGPFINDDEVQDIEKELAHNNILNRYAAILALQDAEDKSAKRLLSKHSGLAKDVSEKNLDWDKLGKLAQND